MEFGDFNKISEKIWNQSLSKALKLEDLNNFEKKKYQDIELPSFNFPKTNQAHLEPLICGSTEWIIGTKIEANTNQKNAQLLSALSHGAEAIQPKLGKNDSLKECLHEVYLSMIYTDLTHCSSDQSLKDYLTLCQDSKKSVLRGAINFQELTADTRSIIDTLDNFHLYTISSQANSITIELSELIKQMSEALILAKENNLARNQIRVVTSVGVYLPANVAKLRAIRLLWANLLKANGLDFQPIFIVAQTDTSPESTPENKLIENTSATINAVLGNANLIYNGNFGEESGRLDQNIQHILKMEANLHRITDPLAGSYAIETLSSSLAKTAWSSQEV